MTGYCVSAYGKTEYLGKTADYKIGGIFLQKSVIMVVKKDKGAEYDGN